MSTVIYSVEHNSGPSWSGDYVHVDGLASTEEKARAIFGTKFANVLRYEKDDPKVYAKSSINQDAERVFLCGADGWWWGIFKHEVE